MRSLLIVMILCVVSTISTRSLGQNRLDLYADQAMSECSLVDTSPGIKLVHVFFNGTAAAVGVGFTVPRPACWQGATWVSDLMPGPRGWSGTTQSDFFVTLGEPGDITCKTGPRLVCSVVFSTLGTASACCQISVAPIVTNNALYYIECGTFKEIPIAIGQKVTINPDASCPCMLPVVTEPSTWGRVKSLYR